MVSGIVLLLSVSALVPFRVASAPAGGYGIRLAPFARILTVPELSGDALPGA